MPASVAPSSPTIFHRGLERAGSEPVRLVDRPALSQATRLEERLETLEEAGGLMREQQGELGIADAAHVIVVHDLLKKGMSTERAVTIVTSPGASSRGARNAHLSRGHADSSQGADSSQAWDDHAGRSRGRSTTVARS